VIGLAGSVAVGKSTIARVLQALLAHWPSHPEVDLVTTDGFLLPLRALEAKGLTARKGFPESYDLKRLVQFMADVKAGADEVLAPVYSHLLYDVVPGQYQAVRKPDIVLVEGLNVLHVGAARGERPRSPFVSDFFDFSIYIDADEADIEGWYVDRFLALRDTVFTDPSSYFHRYASLSTDDAIQTAREIWRTVNAVNLRENVLPSSARTSSSRRGATTPFGGSGCGHCSRAGRVGEGGGQQRLVAVRSRGREEEPSAWTPQLMRCWACSMLTPPQ
jgi:type I pantothenate kinase